MTDRYRFFIVLRFLILFCVFIYVHFFAKLRRLNFFCSKVSVDYNTVLLQ